MPTPCRTIYKRDLELRASLDEKIKSLRREASDLAGQLKELDKAILAYTKANADKSGTLTRSGWLLQIVTKKNSVKWKNLFLDACGRKAVDDAEAGVETYESIAVTPLKAAAG